MVDDLGNLDDVITSLRKDIDRGDLDVIKYEMPFSFPGFLTMTMQNFMLRNQDPLGIKQVIKYTNSPSLMYLYNME